MHRLLTLWLFLGAAADLLAGPIAPGIFNGYWSVTNARTDVVTSGPLSIVFPENGRPVVHFWKPFVHAPGEVLYGEESGRALMPSRRSILWSMPRYARLHGVHENALPPSASTISGTVRIHELGRGTFTTERFRCSPEQYNLLMDQQRALFDLYDFSCNGMPNTNAPLTNVVVLPPRDRLTNPPPVVILPPTPIDPVETLRLIELRRLQLHSNSVPLVPILAPVMTNTSVVVPVPTSQPGVIRAWADGNYLNGDGVVLPSRQ